MRRIDMRKETVVSAPKRARIDARGVAPGETPSAAHSAGTRRAYYTALGKLALQNMRNTLGWCRNTLRLPGDRQRRDGVGNRHEQ
jgi:hypothetical protein